MAYMKFYLTYPSRKDLEDARHDLGNHSGNIIATFAGPIAGDQGLSLAAWVPTQNKPNSEVRKAKISMIYLLDYTRAISEAEAREIHPKLFRAIVAGELRALQPR